MAVTLAELISKRDKIKQSRGNLYEIETSVGTIIATAPSMEIVADAWNLSDNMESNEYLILECVKEPNLKDNELQKAYEVVTSLDIIPAIFKPGEISRIATALLELAGFKSDAIPTKLYEQVKN